VHIDHVGERTVTELLPGAFRLHVERDPT
jgi:hypothetical protein